MKKKNFLSIVFICLTIVGLSSCGSSVTDNSNINTLSKIKERGKLIVGTSADYPPYEYLDLKTQEPVGFEMDMAKYIADDLDVKLEINNMSFDSLLGALKMGKIDMIISGMQPNDERKKTVDFSDIYFESGQVAIVRKGDGSKYSTLDEFKGIKVAVQTGSIQADIANEQIKDSDVTELSKISDSLLQLKQKKVDATIVEKVVAECLAKANSDIEIAPYSFVAEDMAPGSAVAIQKGNTELLKEVNKTINRTKEDGSFDASVEKHQKDAIDSLMNN